MKRALVAAVLLLAVLLAAGAWIGLGWLKGRGLAQRDGAARIPGLSAAVEVRFDDWGVPHLAGASGRDLAAALGWLHANDRFAQMELGRRVVAGRVSEVLGERGVEVDLDSHRMRFRQAAEGLVAAAGPESRAWLEAYAAGVNAWLEARRDDLPPTLTLLRIEPEPWTPADSLSQAVLMGRDLSFWQGRPEELRFEWLAALGPERTRELIGDPGLELPAEILELAAASGEGRADAEAGRRSAAGFHGLLSPAGAWLAAAPGLGGSNNWALGPGHAAGGLPLVASDPHLAFRLPGVWFQARLRAPDYEAAGMTLPGLPGVVIGRGRHLAWAMTNLMLDDHDVVFERLGEDGRTVRRHGAWLPLAAEHRSIEVRGGDPIEVELLSSDLGPLLPADAERGLPPRSLLWTGYQAADPLAAFLHLARARRVAEVPDGIDGFVCPAQNLVAADDEGGLLYTVLGRLPVRRSGDGRLPSAGWGPDPGWQGLLAPAEHPRIVDPPDGLLVTANHDTRPAGWAGTLAAEFDLPARAERIRQLLGERTGWSPDELGGVQTDVVSLYARRVVERLPDGFDGAAGRGRAALAGWDGTMEAAGPAALFALFEWKLLEHALGDEIDLDRSSAWAERGWIERLLGGEMRDAWFDDVTTDEVEDRRQIVRRALEQAWAIGRGRWGNDVAEWSYGSLHRLLLRHPLGTVPFLDRMVNRGPFEVPGSETTVLALGGDWVLESRPVRYGPSMRWITAAGGDEPALAVLPGGQAGHPWDPHYDDQLPLYLEGRLRPAPWSEADVAAATRSILTLEP